MRAAGEEGGELGEGVGGWKGLEDGGRECGEGEDGAGDEEGG